MINNLFKSFCKMNDIYYINDIIYLKGGYSIYDEAIVFALSKDTEEPYNEVIYDFKVKGIHYD